MHRRTFSNNEFAFWLQGALEISDMTCFTEEHVMLIRQRLNDVKDRDNYTSSIWLTLALLPPDQAFEEIIKLQHNTFVHDIDPTYDGDQEHFQAVHDGKV